MFYYLIQCLVCARIIGYNDDGREIFNKYPRFKMYCGERQGYRHATEKHNLEGDEGLQMVRSLEYVL